MKRAILVLAVLGAAGCGVACGGDSGPIEVSSAYRVTASNQIECDGASVQDLTRDRSFRSIICIWTCATLNGVAHEEISVSFFLDRSGFWVADPPVSLDPGDGCR